MSRVPEYPQARVATQKPRGFKGAQEWMSRARRSQAARFAPWLFTVAAMAYIVLMIPWRDRLEVIPRVTNEEIVQSVRPIGPTDLSAVHDAPVIHHYPGVFTLLGRIRWPWIMANVACMVASAGALIARWHGLLRQSCEDAPPFIWCARTWAQAQVVGLLPIGQVGADAFRVERSAQFTSLIGRCVGIVAIERLMGLLALLLVGAIGMAMKSPDAGGIAMLIVTTTIAVFAVTRSPRRIGMSPQADEATCTSEWRTQFNRWFRALGDVVRRPRVMARVLGLSIIVQMMTPLSFTLIDRALGFETPMWCYLIAVPAVILAQFLPIHVAGIGILEGGLGALLGPWAGRTPSEVIALSATFRILNLAWSGLLALSFLMQQTSQSQSSSVTPPPSGHDAGPCAPVHPVEMVAEETPTTQAAGPVGLSQAVFPFPTRSQAYER